MSSLQIPEWRELDWLEHGFGTRQSEGWTNRPERAWAKQIHSNTVLEIARPGLAGEGDSLLSQMAGVFLEVRTADCVPVLLVDTEQRAFAAVHAGWRGVEGEIVPATVRRLMELGNRNLQAAIGPSIGECCFEVGPEVALRFGRSGRTNLNLKELIKRQLFEAGLRERDIFMIDRCTKCEADQFHSYRRDGEAAGRMTSGISARFPR